MPLLQRTTTRIHRHEPPVTEGMPEIVNLTKAHGGDGSAMELDGFTVEGEGVPDQLVMVNKPSSIPVSTNLADFCVKWKLQLTVIQSGPPERTIPPQFNDPDPSRDPPRALPT